MEKKKIVKISKKKSGINLDSCNHQREISKSDTERENFHIQIDFNLRLRLIFILTKQPVRIQFYNPGDSLVSYAIPSLQFLFLLLESTFRDSLPKTDRPPPPVFRLRYWPAFDQRQAKPSTNLEETKFSSRGDERRKKVWRGRMIEWTSRGWIHRLYKFGRVSNFYYFPTPRV